MDAEEQAAKLTMAELEIAEHKAGCGIDVVEDPGRPKARMLAALAWLIAKRMDQDLTFDDFRENRTLDQVREMLGLGDDADDPFPGNAASADTGEAKG